MMEAWAGDVDELQVFVEIDPDQPWIPLATFGENTPSWTRRTIDLPRHEGSVRLVFAGTANYGYGVHIDSIQVTGSKPVCAPGTLVSPTCSRPWCSVAWTHREGYTYRVLAASSVEGPFEVVAEGLTTTQEVDAVSVSDNNQHRVRFFRIEEVPAGASP
jgi:hypothetical protein